MLSFSGIGISFQFSVFGFQQMLVVICSRCARTPSLLPSVMPSCKSCSSCRSRLVCTPGLKMLFLTFSLFEITNRERFSEPKRTFSSRRCPFVVQHTCFTAHSSTTNLPASGRPANGDGAEHLHPGTGSDP